jgi:hypothetical protein
MKIKTFLPLSVMALMLACSPTTKLEKSWADPSLASIAAQPFTKILVIAPMKDESSKRIAEDKIVSLLKPEVGIPSYSYLKSTDNDQKQIETKLKNDGFDGVILMRLVNVDKTVTYSGGTTYGGWFGYRYATPGYVSNDKTYYVETNFYSVKAEKLLWTGTTSSMNPTKVEDTIDQIIAANKAELLKRGLLKK